MEGWRTDRQAGYAVALASAGFPLPGWHRACERSTLLCPVGAEAKFPLCTRHGVERFAGIIGDPVVGARQIGERVEWAAALLSITLNIVKRPGNEKGFVVLARRWVVERIIACLNRCRRLSKDFEQHVKNSEAMV